MLTCPLSKLQQSIDTAMLSKTIGKAEHLA